MAANPVRGQLSRENEYFTCPRSRLRSWSRETGVWSSHPASACSFSTPRLNKVLTHGIPPDSRGRVHLFIPPTAIGPIPSLSVMQLRTNGIHCRESADTRQVVFEVVPVTVAVFSGITMKQLMRASLFSHPPLV